MSCFILQAGSLVHFAHHSKMIKYKQTNTSNYPSNCNLIVRTSDTALLLCMINMYNNTNNKKRDICIAPQNVEEANSEAQIIAQRHNQHGQHLEVCCSGISSCYAGDNSK